VHPTGGRRRVFEQFAWLEVVSDKIAFSPPAHPRVTHTVGRHAFILKVGQWAKHVDRENNVGLSRPPCSFCPSDCLGLGCRRQLSKLISFLFSVRLSCLLVYVHPSSNHPNIHCWDSRSKWWWSFARDRVIMAQGHLSGRFARSVSSRTPKRFQHLQASSVKPCRPTLHAPDKWESSPFMAWCWLLDGLAVRQASLAGGARCELFSRCEFVPLNRHFLRPPTCR
jgi:hypothetical protein